MSPRAVFETELRKLQADVEEMGMEVLRLYIKMFWAQDKKEKENMKEISMSGRDFHIMQRKIESYCLDLITKQQPVARDLRRITAALKVVNDISRIGDQCVDIAELLLRMNLKPLAEFSTHLEDMIEETKEQLTETAEAFGQKDICAAKNVIQKDDVIDNLFNLIKNDLIHHLKEEGKDSDDCVDVLMIAKHLEKIGDHAVNMAEWTIFCETGKINDIRLL